MLRKIVWVLLAVNLILALWVSGVLDRKLVSDGREPERLDQQVKPEGIRIIKPAVATASGVNTGNNGISANATGNAAGASPINTNINTNSSEKNGSSADVSKMTETLPTPAKPAEIAPNAPPGALQNAVSTVPQSSSNPTSASVNSVPLGAVAPPPSVSNNPAPSVSPAPVVSNALATQPNGTVACVVFGAYIPEEAKRFEDALKPLNLGKRLVITRTEVGVSYMVYVPPFENKAEAEKAAKKYAEKGVIDYLVFNEKSPWKYGIGLGVLPTEEQAQTHLNKIRARGVKEATIVVRNAELMRYFFEVRDLPNAEINRLRALKSSAGVEVKPC